MKEIKQYIKKLADQEIFEAIGDAVSIQDTDYKVLYQNKVHKDLIGDHIGEYCYQAYEKKEDICEGCPVAKTFEDGTIHKAERTAPTDKGTLYVDITASPLKDSDGKIIAGIEIVRDITDRKKMEYELYESAERYSNLFHSSNDGIFIHNTEGTIIEINNKALEQFGYLDSDISSLKISDLHPPEALEASKESFENILQNKHVNFEIDFKKKNGEIFSAEVSSSLFETKGKKLIQGIVRDISEQKQMSILLNNKVRELEEFYEMAVDRELKMIELKKEIEILKSERSE